MDPFICVLEGQRFPILPKKTKSLLSERDSTFPGSDVSIIATGHLVWEALDAAKMLNEQGISAEVINIHTIKPLDEKIVIESVKKTRAVVSCEEHNFLGGLGESISRTLALYQPTPQEFVATQDTFGESGTPAQLMEKYGLNAHSIVNATNRVIARKQ